MRIQRRIGAIAVVLAAACASAEGTSVAALEKVPVVGFESLFHRLDSVMLVTPVEEALGVVTGVVVLPGAIVVSDGTRGNLKVFSRQGRMVRTIGKPGDGPGEFRMPIGIIQDGRGRLVVLDVKRSVLSTRDTSGTLLEERVMAGSWDALAELPGSDHVLLIGARVRQGREQGVGGEHMAVHDVDPAGTITTSYHAFKWPSDPLKSTFTHHFAAAVGDYLVTGAYSSNRVYLIDRRRGTETSALVGGPWYRSPNWSKRPAVDPAKQVGLWARQQTLMMRLFPVDGGRFLAQFRSYTAEGEELYRYVLVNTEGVSLVSTDPTPLRILSIVGETAYGIVSTDTGDMGFETLKLTLPDQP